MTIPEIKSTVSSLNFLTKLVQNWHLVTAGVTISMAGVAYLFFGFTPFEDAINKREKQKIVSFYKDLGNQFILKGKNEEAKRAFKKACELDNFDAEAVLNLEKLKIFDTSDSAKYYSPVIVDIKLQLFKKRFPNDALIYCLAAERYMFQDDTSSYRKAKECLQTSLAIDSKFVPAYSQYAIICQYFNETDSTIIYLNKALQHDSTFSDVLANLGYAYLIKQNFNRAIECMKKSSLLEMYWGTDYDLGNAYRCAGRVFDAVETHKNLVSLLSDRNAEREIYCDGGSFSQFLPENDEDIYSSERKIFIRDMNDKLVISNFQLAIDYFFIGNETLANTALKESMSLLSKSSQKQYLISFLINNINYCLFHHKNLISDNVVRNLNRTLKKMPYF
jgi:tetratricopeptide (TPR) repeat protein